jgi:hypothetical protein
MDEIHKPLRWSADILALCMAAGITICGLLSVFSVGIYVQLSLYFCLILFFLITIAAGLVIAPKQDLALYAFIPVLTSAIQNIYLGFIASAASNLQIQAMITVNYVFAVAFLTIMFFANPEILRNAIARKAFWISLLIFLYSIFTALMFRPDAISALASLRNIMTPFLFFFLGLLVQSRCSMKRLHSYVMWLSLAVVAFGIFERYIYPDIWQTVHVKELWEKKGIPVPNKVPNNFYASEKIDDKQILRMVSSFADPVNLGTFVFFAFCAAWYWNHKWIATVLVVVAILAVSKGAFVGFLVFIIVWSYCFSSRLIFYLAISFSALFAIGFVFYSINYSTLSLAAHVLGFVASVRELPSHPFGRGIGNIGVLAGLFSSGADSEILESGIGMIIGQLGIVGLLLYVMFLRLLYRVVLLASSKRLMVFGLSLLFAIILNSMFNEVALSPNSSAGYFLTLGLIAGSIISTEVLILTPHTLRLPQTIQ